MVLCEEGVHHNWQEATESVHREMQLKLSIEINKN